MFSSFRLPPPSQGIQTQVEYQMLRAGVFTAPCDIAGTSDPIQEFTQPAAASASPINWSPTPTANRRISRHRPISPMVLVPATPEPSQTQSMVHRTQTQRDDRREARRGAPGARFRFSAAKYFLTYSQVSVMLLRNPFWADCCKDRRRP